MNVIGEVVTRTGSRIKTTELEWNALEWLAFNLNETDRCDIFGMVGTDNPLQVAWQIMHATSGNNGLGWLVWLNGRPAGGFGVYENHRGCWSIWSLGADNPSVALVLLTPLLEIAIPHIRRLGGRRLECKSRTDRTGMRDLLRLLGFTIEGTLREYGTDGADYFQYGYLLEAEAEDDGELADAVAAPSNVTHSTVGSPIASAISR